MRAMRATTPCLIPSAARVLKRRKLRPKPLRSNRRQEMRKSLAVVLAAGAILLAAAPVWAHHAFAAEFDSDKPIKLKGTVTKMEWINPHAWIHIDVKGEDGTVTNWMIEAAAP